MKRTSSVISRSVRVFALGVLLAYLAAPVTAGQGQKPNILVIMADDIGVWNISAYHRGMMGGRTPNIDRLAAQEYLTDRSHF